MKNYFIIFFIMFCFSACGQKTITSNIIVSEKYKDITADNFVERMLAEVKHYKEEPMYFIRPAQNNCVYEILVNDVLMCKEYTLDVYASPIEINSGILKSGSQTVTVRMYPIGDLLKDEYDMGNTVTTLLDNTSMKVEVVKYKAYNIKRSLKDEETVLTHYSPKKPNTKQFIGTGLPYYEYTFSFNAKVPYNIEGWQNSQDLTELDEEEIENQVKKYYKQVKQIYLKEDINALTKINFGSYLMTAQCNYFTKQDIQETLQELEDEIKYEKKDFGDLENKKLTFYGNGKFVALRHSSFEPIDKRLRGKSAFWFKYVRGDRYRGYFPAIDLHLPKGESLSQLRMID